jgi:cysteine-rich secretory family protein
MMRFEKTYQGNSRSDRINAAVLSSILLCVAAVSSAKAQTQYSIGPITNEQQYMLELINRARADGGAEAARLGLSGLQEGPPNYNGELWTIANSNQPLSWNPLLHNSSHTQATNLNNADQFFLGIDPHTFGGMTPAQRIAAAGYSEAAYTGPTTSPSHFFPGPENIAEQVSSGSGPYTGSKLVAAVLNAHNALFTDGSTPSRGHRNTMMLGFFREVGIGISVGTDNQGNPGQPNGTWNSLYIVQDYGSQTGSTPFITGVVYQDINANGFYDPGEGLAGVRVDVADANFYAVTASSGGYSVPVPGNGSYSLRFSGDSVVTAQGTAVVANLLNTKIDYFAEVLAGITGIARSGNDIIVNFTAVAGRNYRLERKHNLTDSTWQSIAGVSDFHAVSNGTAPITDPNAISQGQEFYRVRLLP